MKIAVFEKKVKHSEKIYDYYHSRVEPILSKRTFKPRIQEKIPYPLTALYPAKIWAHFDEMKHCIGARIPNPFQVSLHYYWRYDGTCGGYADRDAKYLVIDPPSKKEEKNYDPLLDPANKPCLENYPAHSTWIADDQLKGLRCMDVIPLHQKSLSSDEKQNRIHYIILGKHSNDLDCGSQ